MVKSQTQVFANSYMFDTSKIHNLLKALSSIIVITLFLAGHLHAQNMWINEFHYDNIGGDIGEFIEVVVETGVAPADVSVVLYDGADRDVYNSNGTHALTSFSQGDTENQFTIYSKSISGIQNGDPDAIALVYQGVVVEFISYEGSFVAANGVAAGYQSLDIGVAESNGATPLQSSISRLGTGTNGSDFTWQEHVSETPGSLNVGQDLSDPNLASTLTDAPQSPATEPVTRGDAIKYTIELSNTGDGDANDVSIDRKAPLDPNTTLVPGSFKSTPLAYDAVVLNVQEDVAKTITLTGFDLDGDLLTYSIATPPSSGSLGSVMPVGPTAGIATIQYTPNVNYFGPDQFEFTVTDDDGNSCPGIVKIMVQPVNDPPTITCGPNQSRPNSVGPANEPGWATGISVGPTSPPAPNGDESAFQSATVTTVNDNNAIFSVQPAVDAAGTLTYTPMAGATGTVNVTVTISDGVYADDVSCDFTITIQAFPDALDDDFAITNVTDLNGNLFNDNGNGADDLGFPAGTITGFGGGSLAGGPGTNAPGATVALAAGTLQVNANGTFSLTGQPFIPGTYTFLYTLDNGLNTDVATVTIVINAAPVAQDDAFTMVVGNNLSGDVNDDNGSGADDLGTPAATVSHFGAGSLGGLVTDNVAGSVVALAGGTFTILANGDLSLNGANLPGVYTVDYRLTNVAGTSDATVTITIQKLPDAIADDFSTQEDTDLNGDLFANNGNGADDLGSPAGVITHFGGGSLAGSVTDNVAGSTVALAGGTLQVNANGTFSLSGQPFSLGTYTFMYRLANVVGSDDAIVTITINPADVPPTIASHTPVNNAMDVTIGSDITVTFSEPVSVTNPASFTIVGSSSGIHTYMLSGGPTSYTLNPDLDFNNFEDVTLTVVANQVSDNDVIDPPDNMAMDFVCTFKTIGLAPVCTDDAPAANSAPGDDFHTALNTTLNAADGSSEDLLANDNVGVPAALITEFGPTVAVGTTAGSPGASANGGTVTVNANGSFDYTPPNNFTGLDVFFYELENQYGTVVCQATVAVGLRPVCGTTDGYTATGNIQISIPAISGVLGQ